MEATTEFTFAYDKISLGKANILQELDACVRSVSLCQSYRNMSKFHIEMVFTDIHRKERTCLGNEMGDWNLPYYYTPSSSSSSSSLLRCYCAN